MCDEIVYTYDGGDPYGHFTALRKNPRRKDVNS